MNERLPAHVILEVRQRAPLEAVVGRVVRLKRQGGRLTGLCPFHHEKTPSFGIPRSGRYFKCFGCGAAGDAIRFTMLAHGLDFSAAVRSLAQDLGIPLGSQGNEPADSAALAASREALRKRQEEWARAEEQRAAEEREERENAIAWCRRVWHAAKDAPPDFALLYLRGRGLLLDALPPSIRCQPRMAHKESGRDLPCMLAGIQNVEGQIVGLHRTFLHRSPDGRVHKTALRPAKKMNGEAWGGAVRLSMPAPTLVIGEGIETVLSVMAALGCLPGDGRSEARLPARSDPAGLRSSCASDSSGQGPQLASGASLEPSRRSIEGAVATDRPGRDASIDPTGLAHERLAFWAALSLGNLSGRGLGLGPPHPHRVDQKGKPVRLPSARPDPDQPGICLPGWARRVVILADQDNADPPAAEQLLQRAANRFRAEGRDVRIARPPEGCDFNDVLRGAA